MDVHLGSCNPPDSPTGENRQHWTDNSTYHFILYSILEVFTALKQA